MKDDKDDNVLNIYSGSTNPDAVEFTRWLKDAFTKIVAEEDPGCEVVVSGPIAETLDDDDLR